jgi:hypothetical protein
LVMGISMINHYYALTGPFKFKVHQGNEAFIVEGETIQEARAAAMSEIEKREWDVNECSYEKFDDRD